MKYIQRPVSSLNVQPNYPESHRLVERESKKELDETVDVSDESQVQSSRMPYPIDLRETISFTK